MKFLSWLFVWLVGCLTLGLCVSWAPIESIRVEAENLLPWMSKVRRNLHQFPELLFDLNKTNQLVRDYLEELEVQYKQPYAKSGIVATIGSGKPVVALRADMDALPIQEPDGLYYKSKNEGQMHACGHDAHMTMLLGAASILKDREQELKGTVKLVFQPAEEGGAGGDIMVKEGVVDDVSMMFGMHVWPYIPTGVIASKPKTIMASSTAFQVYVLGKGGHGAMPHQTKDPIIAATNMKWNLLKLNPT
eukprot:TRINITY_DN73192_c0_g1_i1.p1 TRINITY_DN73192_c0_g1~~TRINITY_DN73192_c0_g1_i1.p1  ORF type:complete len:247 (-),score=25.00 TRINITY_DN73192_c0_g1_i1:68-808(-)